MNHEELQILISAYIDGQVTPDEKIIVEEHLKTCVACQNDFKSYKSISSLLSNWSNETLSPDEEIKVLKTIEKRRATMFTKRSLGALVGTLCVLVIVGSLTQNYLKRGIRGQLKSAADDITDQYTASGSLQKDLTSNKEPFYLAESIDNRRLGNVNASTYSVDAASTMRMLSGRMQSAQVVVPEAAGNFMATDSNTSYYAADEERKKIERADITLKVDNAFKAKSQISDLIQQFNGIIMNSEFNRAQDGSGHGTITCKVYPKDLESTLKEIRKLGDVQEENESSTDITDQYNDANDNRTKYTEDKARLEKQLNEFRLFNPTTDEQKADIQAKIDQTQQEINALDRVIKYYQDQSSMSVVVINYYDTFQNPAKPDDSSNQWKSNMDNKWKMTLHSSVDTFTSIFFGILIILSYIVPVLIWCVVFGIVYFVIRLFIKK